MDKKKSVLDVTVVKLVCQLELSVCMYIDKSMPKKFRPTLVQQLVNGLGMARKYTIKSMDLSPRFAIQKLYYMEEAMSETHNAEAIMNTLNDLQSISNEAKAKIDMQLADIYANFNRLLSSFNKHAEESDTQRQADASELTY